MATALALARQGYSVRILEGRDAFYETGAGLQLGPHAVKVLERLGLTHQLAEAAVAPEAIFVFSARTAREITRIPLGAYARARYGAPYWCLHREDLHRTLSAAVSAEARIGVNFGFRVATVAEDADGVRLTDSAGHRAEGSALIGADGLWSAVRKLVAAQSRVPATPSGWIAWRAIVPMACCPEPIPRNAVGLWLGPDAHVVHYPIRQGTLVNLVVVIRDTFQSEGFDHHGDPTVLGAMLASWPDELRSLIGAAEGWQRWALFMRPERAAWARGRVLLAGDAAHPVLPFLAQGAALALEDAWRIAAEAGRPGDPPSAWQAVEARRRARAEAVAAASRRNARIYHLSGLAGLGRDWSLGCIGGRRLLSAYDWLYGHDETAGGPVD